MESSSVLRKKKRPSTQTMKHKTIKTSVRNTRKRKTKVWYGIKHRSRRPVVNIHKYENGLTFLYEPSLNPSLGLTCFYLFIRSGSSNEPKGLNGVSHLIEHMIFKATKTHKQDSLLRVFDSTGSKFNAYTTKDVTCFYILCATEHTKHCMKALSEMLIHAMFDATEFEKEQNVVHEENMQDETDSSILLQNGMDIALFPGTPYETPIDYLHKPLNRQKVMDYYLRHYLPDKMVMSIVSSAPYESMKKVMDENSLSRFNRFDDVPSSPSPSTGFEKIESPLSTTDAKDKKEEEEGYQELHKNMEIYRRANGTKLVLIKIPDNTFVQVAIGFPTCAWENTKDRKLLKLVKLLFSRGLNGYLYNALREKHGLSYTQDAHTEYYNKVGKFTLSTEIEPSRLFYYHEKGGKKKKGVLPILFELLRDFILKGPTPRDWEDVKGYYHGKELIQMENSKHLAEYNGQNYLFTSTSTSEHASSDGIRGSRIDSYLSNWDKYIRPSTIQDCRECVRKYFTPSTMCIALAGGTLPSTRVLEKCINTHFKLT